MKNIKEFNDIEELIIKNTLMMKVLRGYCMYDITKAEEIANILVGIDFMLEQQEKITKLLENL